MSRPWKAALCVVGGASLVIVVGLAVATVEVSRHLNLWVAEWLSQQYRSTVELANLHVSITLPIIRCDGDGLTLYFQGRRDLPPLLTINHFTLRGSAWELLGNPRRVASLDLRGLQINVPPREHSSGHLAVRSFLGATRRIQFANIRAEDAVLRIFPRDPAKKPHEFDIHNLRLSSHGAEGGLNFQAVLTNPAPPGEITSSGVFGPWDSDTPSLTPVSGSYKFDHADLGVFRGIAGILSSQGRYDGVLEKIHVAGTTDTPDFRVIRAGHAVDLSTTFDATVDGTDGDTYLHPVECYFGQTELTAQGKVERQANKRGRVVRLSVASDRGSIEDLLHLAVHTQPPLTGPVRMKATFVLPSGKENLMDRLQLQGSFALDGMHFTNSSVQQKIDNMSKRSEGKPKEVVSPSEPSEDDDVPAAVSGTFELTNGLLRLWRVSFDVPGAETRLAGTYALKPETMDLAGTLKIRARVSQTTTGFKSMLLRLADPLFFKKGQGSVIPIQIEGPVEHPQYRLNWGRVAQSLRPDE